MPPLQWLVVSRRLATIDADLTAPIKHEN